MNPYEKKFKECYNMLKSNIQNDQENIERDTKELEALLNLERSYMELKNSGYENTIILDTLYKTAKDNEPRIKCLRSCIERRKRGKEEHKDQLSFLSNYLCPHEKRTYDYTNAHNGEDHYICDFCGKTIRGNHV